MRASVDPAKDLTRIFEELRASRFEDIKGARITATVPVGERLLNQIVAAALPRSGPVREAAIQPQPQNRLLVRARLARPEFLPPVSATLVIERQPQLPHAPLLVFRVTGLPGLLAMAGPLLPIASMLPAGIRLEGDLLTVDLAALLAAHGQQDLLGYLDSLRVTTEAQRLVIELTGRVS